MEYSIDGKLFICIDGQICLQERKATGENFFDVEVYVLMRQRGKERGKDNDKVCMCAVKMVARNNSNNKNSSSESAGTSIKLCTVCEAWCASGE